MTLPRYLAVTRPGSRQDVVEADAGLAALVAEHLPLPVNAGVTVHTVDARAWLEAAPTAARTFWSRMSSAAPRCPRI